MRDSENDRRDKKVSQTVLMFVADDPNPKGNISDIFSW